MATMQALRVQVIPLTAAMADEVAELYARVFAGPPWFEIKRCAHCEETYGHGDDLERFHDGDPCRRCGEPLHLLDYWRGGRALEVFADAIARPGFIGMAARAPDGRLIAFSWGFAVPTGDTPSVLFGTVAGMLTRSGIDVGRAFYAAETGVDPDHQHQGIGSQVSYARLRRVRDAGFATVCFRTINPKMLQVFERFFRPDRVSTLFHDPDPLKTDRLWYAARVTDLRDLPALLPSVGGAARVALSGEEALRLRFDEYRLLLGDLGGINDLRRRTTDVHLALNGLFLTGIGVLVLSSHLASWWTTGAVASVAVLALVINGFWLRALKLYRQISRVELSYAAGIERLLREMGSFEPVSLGAERAEFGIFSLLGAKLYGQDFRSTRTRIEQHLAISVTLCYPVITAIVAALTYLIGSGYLPPIKL